MAVIAGCSPKLPDLPVSKVTFGESIIYIEVADTQEKRMKGLMDRTLLSEDQGMLFDFKASGRYRFWMKNTYIPLSIAFLDQAGNVLKITDMEPLDAAHFHASPPGTYYALETNRGWFRRHNVKEGDIGHISIV